MEVQSQAMFVLLICQYLLDQIAIVVHIVYHACKTICKVEFVY